MFELLAQPWNSKAQCRSAIGSSRTVSHAVRRRLIHFEEVGANLCAAGLTSRRVIRLSSLHGTVLFLSGCHPQCYQGWKWCTQSYTVGRGQLELTGRDASIAADGLSTTFVMISSVQFLLWRRIAAMPSQRPSQSIQCTFPPKRWGELQSQEPRQVPAPGASRGRWSPRP